MSDNTGIIASVNPFRYRGYYYDQEIGLYYLQSRYYDATVGRFINVDEAFMCISKNNILSTGLFAYCLNSTTNLSDFLGFAPKASEVPPESSGYIPPKGGAKKGTTKDGKVGWLDKNGNVWVPDPSNHAGDHWDVTGKKGYINVGRNGNSWGGQGKVNLPKKSKSKIEFGRVIGGIFITLLIALLLVGVIYLIAVTGGGAAVVFV